MRRAIQFNGREDSRSQQALIGSNAAKPFGELVYYTQKCGKSDRSRMRVTGLVCSRYLCIIRCQTA